MSWRVLQVGLGGRGEHWLDFLSRRSDVSYVGYVDASSAVLDKMRARPGLAPAPFFSSFDEALRQVQADLVLIATPSFLHASQALQALDAGCAVLLEKPYGMSLAEASAVARRARELDRLIMVAENFRFFQAERTLRAFIESGNAGRIHQAVCVDRRDQPSRSQGSWVKSLPHPFLTEIGVHHFDSFRYLLGCEPVSMLAMSYNPPGSDYEHEGGAHALIEFAGGISLQYSGSFVASRYDYELRLECEQGELKTDRVRVWWRPKDTHSFSELPLKPLPAGEVARYPLAGMASIFDQFCAGLALRAVPENSGDDNLWTLAMLDAAILSVREGRQVKIADLMAPPLRAAS